MTKKKKSWKKYWNYSRHVTLGLQLKHLYTGTAKPANYKKFAAKKKRQKLARRVNRS